MNPEDPRDDPLTLYYRNAAELSYGSDDVDIDQDAVVSEGEGGAFVQAWVWVDDPEMRCEACDWLGGACELRGLSDQEIVDAHRAVEPSGKCPMCGNLCFEFKRED